MSKRKRRFRGWSISKAPEADSGEVGSRSVSRGPIALVALGALILAIAFGAVAAFVVLPSDEGPSGPPRAAIVDQLSLTFPNQQFVDEATATLERAGYVVDYFPGAEVTIEFYRQLPTRDYDYVILRSHQAQFDKEWRGKQYDEWVLFTSEPYDPTLYREEQWELELNQAFTFEGSPRYFAVAANFIESRMQGDFGDATVIMMGCGGLGTDRTAEAFVQRGAGAVVGWTDLVSASHTDRATQRFLDKVLLDELSVEAAVAQTMAEIGPDPAYESELLSYPPRYPAGG